MMRGYYSINFVEIGSPTTEKQIKYTGEIALNSSKHMFGFDFGG